MKRKISCGRDIINMVSIFLMSIKIDSKKELGKKSLKIKKVLEENLNS